MTYKNHFIIQLLVTFVTCTIRFSDEDDSSAGIDFKLWIDVSIDCLNFSSLKESLLWNNFTKSLLTGVSMDDKITLILFLFYQKKKISTEHHKYLLIGAFTRSLLLTLNVLLLNAPFATDKLQALQTNTGS